MLIIFPGVLTASGAYVLLSRIHENFWTLTYIGFLEGTLTFLDGSTLHFMEFVNVKMAVNRYKYSYHYQNTTEALIFRYDMAPHHRDVSTFLHHKHLANGEVVDAVAPSLHDVLEEIESMVM